MRGLQIWPHNSNRTTFDPFLGQNTVENWLSQVFCTCSIVVFGQKGVKCYPIKILKPYLESTHHLGYLRPRLLLFTHFDFLPPMHFPRI